MFKLEGHWTRDSTPPTIHMCQVKGAVATVRQALAEEDLVLAGLVNNAGVAIVTALETVPIEAVRGTAYSYHCPCSTDHATNHSTAGLSVPSERCRLVARHAALLATAAPAPRAAWSHHQRRLCGRRSGATVPRYSITHPHTPPHSLEQPS